MLLFCVTKYTTAILSSLEGHWDVLLWIISILAGVVGILLGLLWKLANKSAERFFTTQDKFIEIQEGKIKSLLAVQERMLENLNAISNRVLCLETWKQYVWDGSERKLKDE